MTLDLRALKQKIMAGEDPEDFLDREDLTGEARSYLLDYLETETQLEALPTLEAMEKTTVHDMFSPGTSGSGFTFPQSRFAIGSAAALLLVFIALWMRHFENRKPYLEVPHWQEAKLKAGTLFKARFSSGSQADVIRYFFQDQQIAVSFPTEQHNTVEIQFIAPRDGIYVPITEKSLVDLDPFVKIEVRLADEEDGDRQKALDLLNLADLLRQSEPLKAAGLFEQLATEADDMSQAFIAHAHFRAGLIYFDQKRWSQALEHYKQAMEIRTEYNLPGLAEAHQGIAFSLLHLSQFKDVYVHLNEAYQRFMDLGDTRRALLVATAFGASYEKQGDFANAVDTYQHYLQIAEDLNEEDAIVFLKNSLAVCYNYLDQPVKALSLFEEIRPYFENRASLSNKATFFNNLGLTYGLLGQNENEGRAYQLQLVTATEAGDTEEAARARNNLSFLNARQKNFEEAQSQIQQAIALYESVEETNARGYAYFTQADLFLRWGKPAQAEAPLQKAFAVAENKNDQNLMVQLLVTDARRLRDLGKDADAAARGLEAVDFVEKHRGRIRAQNVQVAYLASRIDAFEFMISLYDQQYRNGKEPQGHLKSLAMSERARARNLLDTLNIENETLVYSDRQLKLEAEQLIAELEEKRRLALRLEQRPNKNAARLQTLATEIESLDDQWHQVQAKIQEKGLLYKDAPLANPFDEEGLAAFSPNPGTTVIVVGKDGEQGLLWLNQGSQWRSYELGPWSDIDSAARNFYQATSQDAADQQSKGRLLAEKLLAPLKDIQTPETLAFVGDGVLQYVPVSALSAPWDNQRLIVEKTAVVRLPSLSVGPLLKSNPLHRGFAWAAWADPVYQENDSRLTGVQVASNTQVPGYRSGPADLDQLKRLPGTAAEIRSVTQILNQGQATTLIGFEATRESLVDRDLKKYKVLHFATHGVVDSLRPEQTGLVLSRFDRTGEPTNGFLSLSDVYDLQIDPELVVLSACDTVLGENVRGEGLMGLSRAFVYAGADQVVAGLWRLQDQETPRFMTDFYRGLNAGLPPKQALHEAQKEAHQKGKSPFHWAAFQIMTGLE